MIATPLYDNGRTHTDTSVDMFHFSGRNIVCGIDLGDDMKGGHGLETGFAYEILKAFADAHNCNISVIADGKDINYVDSLKHGRVDLLIVHHEDIDDSGSIMLSDPMNGCSAWAMKNGSAGEIREINAWLSHYTGTPEFEALKKRFFRSYNPMKRAEKNVITDTVSPYDDLLKQYAAELGWDWRMLAAVVYQESKFSINSRSYRGATGLMQVMPRTGRLYNIDNLTDPQQNLIAGTNHLKRLQRLYRKCDMTHDERIRFTLAAYNAGEGRIMDCRKLAKAQRYDENKWSDVVKVIPMMREDSILTDENVKLGKFQGVETIAYVDNIMDIYKAICQICPQQ